MPEDLQHVLGIDIGSVAVAEVVPSGNMIHFAYHFHHGRAGHTLKHVFKQFDPGPF